MNENNAESTHFSFAKTAVPMLLGWGFAIFWALRILMLNHHLLFPNPTLDLVAVSLIFIAGLARKQFSGFLPAFCLLSYEIHSQSALRIENFQFLYAFSWLLCTFLLYRQPQRAVSLTLYHAGLSFDPGSAVTMGVGMQAGLSAAPVTSLFIALFARELWNGRINFSADSSHFLAVAGLFWLMLNHSHGMAADLTAQFVAFAGSAFLIWTTCSRASDERERQRHLIAIATGGVLVIGAALCNQALESATLSEFFSRRAWAGSLHPNHLATWCLAALCVLIDGFKSNPKLYHNRRVVFIVLFCLMIIISGARIILALTLICLFAHFFQNMQNAASTEKSGKMKALPEKSPSYARWAVIIVVLAIVSMISLRLFYKFDPFELARNERLFIWKAAGELISRAPWTGHGVLQFALLPQQVASETSVWLYDWNYPHSHQGLIEILLWGGIPLLIIFALCWLKALAISITGGSIISILAVSATLIADFTWRTPAMVVMALFFLFPAQKTTSAPQNFSVAIKTTLSLALIAVVFWLMQMHTGFISYNKALASLTTGQGTWKAEIQQAIEKLPFSLDLQMQRLLWKLSRERIDDEFQGYLNQLRQLFPSFWPALFVEARRLELAGDLHTALQLYAQTLEFEPVDLGGIRNARAALLAMRLNDNRLEEFVARAFARGGWGAAMLANHPDFGTRFKAMALKISATLKPADFFAAVKLARIVKNLADNAIIAEDGWQNLAGSQLPDWLYDEVLGAVSLAKAKIIAAKHERTGQFEYSKLQPRVLSQSERGEIDAMAEELRDHGPSCLRTLAWIRLEQADLGGFIAAYDQMLKRYNFRNKNYEDLAGQFAFARFALLSGEPQQAISMLEKLAGFDSGSPFISELMARCHEALNQQKQASFYVNLARKQTAYARLDPFFREEPRNLLWPQGDQWIFLFEKVFRRFDPDAIRYCTSDWDHFLTGLEP